MAILEAKGIKKHFGGVMALCDGNVKCEKGKITGLLGANGSGKSTISKIITGLYKADAGDIIFEGKKVEYRSPIDAKNNGISMVFQNLSLIPDLTVWQNIVLGVEEKKGILLNNNAAKEKSQALIDRFIACMDINKKVNQLGPGEMQIVEIAKAVYETPKVLILDEATAALEQMQVKNLFCFMREIAAQGTAIIFTSHRLWEVMEICDDAVVFRNGMNVGDIDFQKDVKDPDKIVKMITGEMTIADTKKTDKKISDETVFLIENLQYGKMLKDISMHLKQGEILGIGGLANQGQNELMLALAGYYENITGSFILHGKHLKINSPKSIVQNGIFLVPGDRQQQGLYLKESIYTNMAYVKLGLKHQPLFSPKKKLKAESEHIVKELSIKTNDIHTPLFNLSGGNQQKVVVGKWIPFDINILLLADPAKGVDVGAKRDLYNYIIDLVNNKKVSVILYASDNEELIEYCDRLLIMYEGRITAELIKEEITEENIITASMQHVKQECVSV